MLHPQGSPEIASRTQHLREEYQSSLVSIIIPTYDRAHLIGETLASVLAQTYEHVETIVADDGSTDNTGELMVEWERRFHGERGWNLEFLRSDHRGGNAARNRGMQASQGEFIQFLDSDDLLHPEKLTLAMRGSPPLWAGRNRIRAEGL